MELSKTLLEQQPLMPLGAGSNRPQPNLSNYSEKPIRKGSAGDYSLSAPLRTDAPGNARKRVTSGKYLTNASTSFAIRQVSDKWARAFATAATACSPRTVAMALVGVRRSLTIGYEESFQEIAQLTNQAVPWLDNE